MTTPAGERPTFTIRFRAERGVDDPIRALRLALKFCLRRFGLRAIEASEDVQESTRPPCSTGNAAFPERE
jgi:hypothetical protein